MKKIVYIFLIVVNILWADKSIKTDVFLAYGLGGKVKVDETSIRDKYSSSLNGKLNFSYKVYNSMYFLTGLGYETYNVESYDKSYNIMPVLLGIRYMDEKNKIYHPYITLMYGANILKNPEDLPIDTRKNGYASIDVGLFLKEKYFFELSYKHHALTYKPMWPTISSYWNGEQMSLNIGYRVK